MKESACGRIKSQRKCEESLICQYDTNNAITTDRLWELKKKYAKP